MAKNINISKDRKTFLQYYSLYLQHYGRKLSPDSYYYEHNTTDDKFAYIRASENKQHYNTLYNQRYRLLMPKDTWLTVISANSHQYTLAGTYTRRLYGLRVTVFAVITQYTIHEWYIDFDSTEPTYIGRVPAWRTYCHWWDTTHDVTTTEDERITDECYEELA